MWLIESPEDLSAEKHRLSCNSEKFLAFNFQLIFFSCLWQLSRQSGFAVPSACPVDRVTSERETVIPPSLSHEGHTQFYIYMVVFECLCLGPVLSLSQKVSSLLAGVTASSAMWWQSVSVISFKNEVWILKSRINWCSHACTPRLWERCYEITHKS